MRTKILKTLRTLQLKYHIYAMSTKILRTKPGAQFIDFNNLNNSKNLVNLTLVKKS